MTAPPAKRARRLNLAELKDALETVALQQAQIGVAVIALLHGDDGALALGRAELIEKVSSSVNDLLHLTSELMDIQDGA